MTAWPDTVRIGNRLVGGAAPVLVVAEAGVNHNGDLATAIRLVRAAADAHADAVKFQFFCADRLVTSAAPAAGYQKAGDQRTLLRDLELSPADFLRVRAECDALGLMFLATPFSPEDVDALAAMHVPAIKIASPDVTNPPLLRAAAATGLPIILSTGATTMAEVEQATDVLSAAGTTELVLLHCVSGYPTPQSECNLRAMHTLRDQFALPVGFSDHTSETDTAALAVAAGAGLLEKHITISRLQPGPDHFFSLEPDELKQYVTSARHAEAALGHGRREPSPAEHDVRNVARSSVVSACDIAAGARIAADMLTVKRPGGGVEPARIDELVGKVACHAIAADTTIRWEMVK